MSLLHQPNHLVGNQALYLKLRFLSVDDLMKAKRYHYYMAAQ